MKDESEKFGLKINDSKTNVMVMNGVGKVELDGNELETVDQFKYLGSIIRMDDPCAKEVEVRLAMARGITSSLNNIWTERNISLGLKTRIARSLIWSVATYMAVKPGL